MKVVLLLGFVYQVASFGSYVGSYASLTPACVNIKYTGKKREYKCIDNRFCNKKTNILRVDIPPYANFRVISFVMKDCCGECVKLKLNYTSFKNISQVTPAELTKYDFAWPFLGRETSTMVYNQYFIPIWDAFPVIYFTRKERSDLVGLVTSLYPTVVVCISMAIISGFIVWLLEKGSNKEEFKRPFFIGWFDGIWYSIVTMTTVGYGDKKAKTISGKVFSIIWITIGVIGFTIAGGMTTIALMKIDSPDIPIMKDARVATLKYRDFEKYVVKKHGGIVVDVDYTWVLGGVLEMVDMLRHKKIDGFVLDKWTHLHVKLFFSGKIKKNATALEGIHYFMNNTVQTEKTMNCVKYSYGILVRDHATYEYIRHALSDYRLFHIVDSMKQFYSMKSTLDLTYGNISYSEPNALLSPGKGVFERMILTIGCLVGTIFIFGAFYEWRRIRREKSIGETIN